MTITNEWRAICLGWLVLLLSVGAFLLCVLTKGISLVVLPAIAAITVGCTTRRVLAWWLGGFYYVSWILFGLFGLITSPLVLLGTFLLIFILNRTLAVVALVAAVLLGLLWPFLFSARERCRRATDMSNIRQIWLALQMYRDNSNTYPDRLFHLEKFVGSTKVFISPHIVEKPNWLVVGPLRMWFRQYDPGPVRRVLQWSEVDDGDYLYRKPGTNASPDTIVIMTRPGLLYQNGVNVGYFDGHTGYSTEQEWKRRQDVFEFLKDLNLTNLLSLTTNN